MIWSESDIGKLKSLYPNNSAKTIGGIIGRSEKAVFTKAHNLNLKKSPEYLSAMAETMDGTLTRFTKNHTPHNKGKKLSDYLSEDSMKAITKTQFKKGNLPHNTKQNGVITIRKDKSGITYQHIRIDKAKWELLHVHTWKKHNGEIPKGHIVIFKDKNSLNCTIENLELITRTENMKRNTIQRYPKELIRTIKILSNVKSKLKSSESNLI